MHAGNSLWAASVADVQSFAVLEVEDRSIPEVWGCELGLIVLEKHRLYSSHTWRLSRQWMRKMKAPCRLLMMVNR